MHQGHVGMVNTKLSAQCVCGTWELMTVHPMPVSATWSICKSVCMTGKEGYSGKGYTQFPGIPDYRIFMLVGIYLKLNGMLVMSKSDVLALTERSGNFISTSEILIII